MPKKGQGVSEQTREKMRDAARARDSRLTSIYGFSQQFVSQQREAGKSWCSDCKSWHKGKSRRCKDCNHKRNSQSYKDRPEYHRARRQKHYLENREQALATRRVYSLRGYGASVQWYEEKLSEQGNACGICGMPKGERMLSIDHNHACCSTPKKACNKCRRGLLCDNCNRSLERLETFPDWPQKALAYLERYSLNVTDAAQLARHPEA